MNPGQDMNLGQDHNDQDDDYDQDEDGECGQMSLSSDPSKMQIEIEENHSIRVEDKLASQLKNSLLVNLPDKKESERKEPHSITGNNIGWLQVQDLKNAKSTKSQLIQKLLRRGYYLPCHRECTASFLRAVFAGKKRVFKKTKFAGLVGYLNSQS